MFEEIRVFHFQTSSTECISGSLETVSDLFREGLFFARNES